MTLDEQVVLLNRVSYITRLSTEKKAISPSKALVMLYNLGVRR